MKKFALFGDVKKVTETLEAIEALNEGMSVMELAEMFDRMTDEQQERYIALVTAEYKQFGGASETEDERYRRLCGA